MKNKSLPNFVRILQYQKQRLKPIFGITGVFQSSLGFRWGSLGYYWGSLGVKRHNVVDL